MPRELTPEEIASAEVTCGHWRTPMSNPCPHCYPRPTEAEKIDHPPHYGGDVTYEAIKVIEAWGLGFCLGNAVKYIARAGKKGSALEDLRKSAWYINREIERLERGVK